MSVQLQGEEISEIHVLARSTRTPKHIARDVQTALHTQLGVQIDHRKVSIALTAPTPEDLATGPEPAAPPAREPDTAVDSRIRFESVNLFVSGARTQAQVELRWQGLPRMGSASGWSTRDEAHRLIAMATAAAVQEFLADPIAFHVGGVEVVGMTRHSVVVVSLSLLAHRQEKVLTGSCTVGQDTPQAVVLATLAAMNRVVAGLRIKEPVEYILKQQS